MTLWQEHLDHFGGQKSRFLDFLKVVLEMLRSWLGIIFGFKRLTFMCIFSLKGRYLTSKIKNVCQNLALWEGHFGHFGGQTSCFLGFLKVGLELFRSCLGIVFVSKRHTFILNKMLPNDPSPLGFRVSPKTERGARGCVGGWWWWGGRIYLLELCTILGLFFQVSSIVRCLA